MSDKQPIVRRLQDYTPADFHIDTVHLHFDLHEEETIVKAILHMRRNLAAKQQTAPLVLNGREMVLRRIVIDGHDLKEKAYSVTDNDLTVFEVPNEFVLETEVAIKPQENTKLMGLYKSRGNYCTQCEAQGFRRITYYLDRPDVMARFTTTITADKAKYPMLLSNGNLVEEKELQGGRHWVHWEDPSKKPCYLFALVAGDFDLLQDTFTTMSGKEVDCRLYLEKGCADQGGFALQALKRAMRWDEERWGREYDLDIYMIVAVSDFNMGAMENKGLNIFNTKYILAKPETATDIDYIGIENVIGHEYFHNWSGNRVTCRDWFQITLKEGLTVFRDQSFIEDMVSHGVIRINEVNVVRNSQFPEDASPMAHPIRPDSYIEINNFYTPTVYRKGSEVIRMVQTLISRETFRKGLDLYFERHDGQAVTVEDFIQCMADASNKNFAQFFHWYQQAGTPKLVISGEYDEAQKTFVLTVQQLCRPTPGQAKKPPFLIPLKLGLISSECADLPLQLQGEGALSADGVLEITKSKQTFTFANVPAKPVPSLLRDFSAPVEVEYPYSYADLAWLMQCDSNPFSRWDAGQTLACKVILDLADAIREDNKLVVDPIYLNAFEALLGQQHDDLYFFAKLLALPMLSFILVQMQTPDIDALYEAMKFFRQQLAAQFEQQWLQLYENNQVNGPYQYDVKDIGKRSVINQALYYLMHSGNEAYVDMALQQFESAQNMTACMGALVALNDSDCPQREQAMATFYQKWQNEQLVVNKWLGLHATSALPNTLDKVKSLLQHPSFDVKNPNKVYSLVCGFGANTVRFHDRSGAGYEFIADQVMVIDPLNPQVAGRIIQPLTHWPQMDTEHAGLMKKQLERILAVKNLSSDIYEIARKSVYR